MNDASKQEEVKNIEDDLAEIEEDAKPLCDVLSEINNELNENKLNAQKLP